MNGLPLRPCNAAKDSIPVGVLTEAGLGPFSVPGLIDLPFMMLVWMLVGCGEGAFTDMRLYEGMEPVEVGFIRCPMRVFRLLSSVLSSFSRVSVFSFCPSIALGIRSFNPRTSSLIRRVSSSLRLAPVLSSWITFSTSVRALSRRSVRASSALFKVSVSLAS